MTVVATDEKKQKIMKTATKLLTEGSSTVRELAQFIGQVVACFAGVKLGPLWYRSMEHDKTRALKQNKTKETMTQESISLRKQDQR